MYDIRYLKLRTLSYKLQNMKTLVAYLSFMVLPLMCSKAPETENYSNTAPEIAYDMAAEVTTVENKITETIDAAKVIKTANLRFTTTNLDNSYKKVASAITKYHATIQNDNSGKDYNSVYRNITVRVANTNFDAFIAEISKGVGYFDRKEISAQDVTEQYIDIQARIKAKKTLENRYLELLSKANKVPEILEIEKELATIREEIEAKEGQLNYLQSQVSMSTVSIEMYVENASGNNATVSYGRKMGNAIKSGFNGLSTFFLGILYIWPFILILAITFFFVRYKLRKKQK